jgi:hypothetical protein
LGFATGPPWRTCEDQYQWGGKPTLDFYQTINQIGSLRQSAVTLAGFDYGRARAELTARARYPAPVPEQAASGRRQLAPEGGQIAQEMLDGADRRAGRVPTLRRDTFELRLCAGRRYGMRQLAQAVCRVLTSRARRCKRWRWPAT